MEAPVSARHDQCEWAIARSQKFVHAFEKGMITLEEYARNLADSAVATCEECMYSYVRSLPDSLVVGLFSCLEQFLEPVDFMPHPGPFIPGASSPEEIDRIKRQLRPKYVRFYEIVKNKTEEKTAMRVLGR